MSTDWKSELSRQENLVVDLLLEGLSQKELAARLFISPRTAAVHVFNIGRKLQAAGFRLVKTVTVEPIKQS